jgi:tetratricopeptide (TPR) repeat protein
MSLIAVSERRRAADGRFEVAIQFEGGGEYPAEVTDPLAEDRDGERLLTWYFEEHLRYPFLDRDKERAALELLTSYGKELFAQLFEVSSDCSYEFGRYRDRGFDGLRLEIVGGVDFHRVHWESMRSDEAGAPFGARVPIFRRVENVASGFDISGGGPTLNVLAVTARPHGARDVGYRTISRPLLEALRQARIPVRLDLVRPGSWRALQEHLQAATARHGSGWYGIVHFDVHGAVASIEELEGDERADYLLTEDAPGSDGEGAYLFFETPKVGVAEPVSTAKVAALLIEHRVPVAVLNACQSAMQTEGSEASLAQHLVESGVPVAVGMAYSVTVSAAELMMPVIYKQLAEGTEILPAIHAGRRKLFDVRGRRAYFDREIDLEDWILPVVFSQRPVALQPQTATPEQIEEIYAEKSWHVDEPEPEYGFVGRDLDVQAIEQRLLTEGAHNELLVPGMAGAGKSTLLRHLAWWWQATGLVERVFDFSYEDRAWTVDQILQTIIGELLSGHEEALARALPAEAQLERVAALLAADRHLLILDNAESITATPASIPHSLPEEQRTRLRRLLSRLRGGKTLVLVGSRGPERWLAPGSFGSNAYELGGLDPQAASLLQERIISRHGGRLPDSGEERKALDELVEILRGSPLALSVVLPIVAESSPSAVLAQLRRGGGAADPEGVIQEAIEFSHGRLDPATQSSLVVLAPFTGVVPRRALGHYGKLLNEHETVRALGELDIEGALERAIGAGLASPDAGSPNHIRLQPVFPFFLRTGLVDRPELFAAITQAHHDLYKELGPSLLALLLSREPDKRTAGQLLTHAEYANLTSALSHALSADSPVTEFIGPLEEYLDQTHQEFARQQLVEGAIDAVGKPSQPDQLAELARLRNLAGIAALARHKPSDARLHHEEELSIREALDDRHSVGFTYHQLGVVAQEQRRFEEAEAHYRRALEIFEEFDDRHRAARTYHQLGMVAQGQRQFEGAEAHYKKSLEIKLAFDDRHSAASTYHQLGIVAEEQRRFEEAEAHYRNALEIYEEFDDRHSAGITYHQLGTVAQEQRRFEEAEAHYRRALEILEEFDDRHRAARTYHQLGTVAQEQRRFEEAEAHYRRALEIFEEFDDRHRAAGSQSQLGILLTEMDQAADAIRFSLAALSVLQNLTDHWSEVDLRWLKRQRTLLGSDRFRAEVMRDRDKGFFDRLTDLLREVDEPG